MTTTLQSIFPEPLCQYMRLSMLSGGSQLSSMAGWSDQADGHVTGPSKTAQARTRFLEALFLVCGQGSGVPV